MAEDVKDIDPESGTGTSAPVTGGENGRSTPTWWMVRQPERAQDVEPSEVGRCPWRRAALLGSWTNCEHQSVDAVSQESGGEVQDSQRCPFQCEALDHTLDQEIYALMLQIVDCGATRNERPDQKVLFLFEQGLLPSVTGLPNGKTGSCQPRVYHTR